MNASNGHSPIVDTRVFGNHALAMREAGFAVLPARGKEPIRKGFTTWKSAPGMATVSKWAEKDPTADMVYVPGLSRAHRRGDPIIVVDGDDAEATERVEKLFGKTPGMVKTRRGKHFLYRDPGSSLGKISSLKPFGLNADLKHGRSIVACPPSIHEDGKHVYQFDGCDETVIRDLPVFNGRALQALIDASQSLTCNSHPNVTETAPRPGVGGGLGDYATQTELRNTRASGRGVGELRDGSRGQWLNDRLCAHVAHCDTLDDLIDVARTKAQALVDAGYPPLSDEEISARAAQVWKDMEAGHIEAWHKGSSVARTDDIEIQALALSGKHGGDALMLLMKLRNAHQARVLRGETFALNVAAMVEQGTLPGWSRERYENTIGVLLALGFVRRVSQCRRGRFGRVAAQYTLAARVSTQPKLLI
jgi:hypothetical protein